MNCSKCNVGEIQKTETLLNDRWITFYGCNRCNHGWTDGLPVGWHPIDKDTAFAPPFGTIRECIDCGCLVVGGPTRCKKCAAIISQQNKMLDFIVNEIADVAPWEDRTVLHAAAHIRNLILNLRTEANVEKKLRQVETSELHKEIERLREKLKSIHNLSILAWEQVERNPDEAKELFQMIHFHSK